VTIHHALRAIFACATVAAPLLTGLVGGCAASSPGTQGTVTCGTEAREKIDCTSEVSYQGSNIEGGVSVLQFASANAKSEQIALRRVDEETERFIAMQTRLCRDYNACVIEKEAYQREAREIRDRVGKIPMLAEAMKNAKTDGERQQALDELYRGTVRDEFRIEEVSFRMSMNASLPESAGGGETTVFPGAPLPTKSRVYFEVDVSKEAHVYIFQKSPSGEVTVLFPNSAIGTSNPLPGGQRARIPSGDKRFVLNDKDIGVENVFVAVSREPIANLDASLRRVASEQISSIKDDNLLQSFTTIEPAATTAAASPSKPCKTRALELEGGGGPTCSRSRGLDLEGEPSGGGSSGGNSGKSASSFSARTEPGDGMIVKVFPFDHTTEQAFAAKRAQYKPAKVRTRGDILLE
jgi:Domain of unknown function (DUF4384)